MPQNIINYSGGTVTWLSRPW